MNLCNDSFVVSKGYIFGNKGVIVILCIEFVVCGRCECSWKVRGDDPGVLIWDYLY